MSMKGAEAIKLRKAVFRFLERLDDVNPSALTLAECDALVEAMGWESWAAWLAWERERVEAEP